MKKEHVKDKEKVYQEKWEQAVDQLGEIVTSENKEAHQSKLESFETYQKRQKLALHKEFEKALLLYKKAYDVLIQFFQHKDAKLSSPEMVAIIREFTKGQLNLIKVIDSGELPKQIEEGKTFQDILGYSTHTLESCYQAGLSIFEKEHYEDCTAVFSLLTLINPYYHNFWLCLAMSQQAQSHWEPALQAYNIAQMIDPKEPIAFLYAAECNVQLKDNAKAVECFDKAIHCAEDSKDPEFQKLVAVAKQRKGAISAKR